MIPRQKEKKNALRAAICRKCMETAPMGLSPVAREYRLHCLSHLHPAWRGCPRWTPHSPCMPPARNGESRAAPACSRVAVLRGPPFSPHHRQVHTLDIFFPPLSFCPQLSPFSAGFQHWELGQANPLQASDEISPVKPKLLELSSSFYFLWGGSWLK